MPLLKKMKKLQNRQDIEIIFSGPIPFRIFPFWSLYPFISVYAVSISRDNLWSQELNSRFKIIFYFHLYFLEAFVTIYPQISENLIFQIFSFSWLQENRKLDCSDIFQIIFFLKKNCFRIWHAKFLAVRELDIFVKTDGQVFGVKGQKAEGMNFGINTVQVFQMQVISREYNYFLIPPIESSYFSMKAITGFVDKHKLLYFILYDAIPLEYPKRIISSIFFSCNSWIIGYPLTYPPRTSVQSFFFIFLKPLILSLVL